MPATAAARRSAARAAPARTAPARRAPAPRRSTRPRRSQVTPIPGRLVVVGVGRTAGAVGGIADSGLVVRLTRGRLWIGLLATLLVGIVALNVVALGLNASSSKVAQQADGLRRANSDLRARIAGGLTSDNVEGAATKLGLVAPEPGAIRYLTGHSGDVMAAARRLRAGDFGAPATTTPTTVTPPAMTPPVDPATTTTATVDPATDPAVTADTTTPPADTTSTGTTAGGVTAP